MTQAAKSVRPVEGTGCPHDDVLRDLIDDALPVDLQRELVAHLDECPKCRARLESAAGSRDLWTRTAEYLGQSDSAGLEVSQPLADTLRAMDHPTGTVDRKTGAVESPVGEGPRTLPAGSRLGGYELLEVLGRGGMGVVYRAYDEALDRQVAVKVVRTSTADNEEACERFRREARAAAAIRHENVVAIHHVEDTTSGPCLVMELVEGESLDERLQRGGPLPWREVAGIGAEIAAGLAAAHDKGLVHRDVKPGNVLLELGTDRVKLTDFGLAHSLEDSRITREDHLAGTPEYVSPEQAKGTRPDARADLFSLGSVMYAMCTGQPPFAADNPLAVLRRTLDEEPRPLAEFRSDLPAELREIISRLMQKAPADRFQTAEDVAAALHRLSTTAAVTTADEPSRDRPRRGRWLIAATAVFAVGFVGSEVAGLTSTFEAAFGTGPVATDQDEGTVVAQNGPAPDGAKAVVQPQPDGDDDAPARVQIVTPDALLRERIRKEKDELEQPVSPFLVRTYEGHTGPVNALAFTPDSKSLLSASGWPVGDRTLRQWDVESGKQTRLFDVSGVPKSPAFSGEREAPGEFQAIAVTPDGRHAVTTGTGGAVCVWEIATGNLLRTFDEHTGTVYAVAISPDGRSVLTGGRDQIARLWDLATGDELLRTPKHRSFIRAVAFSPDGKQAVTGGLDNTLRLWDLEQAKLVREMPSDNWITSIVFAPSGKRLAAASGRFVDVWDLETGKREQRLKGHASGINDVAYSPDGRRLISGGYDQTVRLWDVDTGKEIEAFLGHRDWVWNVAFAPDGRTALSSGGGRRTQTGGTEPGIDFSIRLWKLPESKPRVIGAQ